MDYEELLDAMMDGAVECPKCGNMLELDGTCHCGGRSLLLDEGVI